MRRLFSPLLLTMFLVCLVGCSNADELNEKEQFICNAISDNFQTATNIEIHSGTAYDDRAYLTISYVSQAGKTTTGQYKITASSITEISSISDKSTTIARYLELSTMTDDGLDYAKISAYLNDEK